MLLELTIENFVLIEKERLQFKEGLNIITGETGAGKSIVFSAIRCLLGQKSTKDLIRKNATSARLEGVFYNDHPDLKKLLADNGFQEEEGQLIITREFNEKRSLIKINGRTCLNSFVKGVGQYLIDFHGQRDNSILLDAHSHLHMIDSFGGKTLEKPLHQIKELVEEYNTIELEIETLEQGSKNVDRELDLLNYQINEIEEASLKNHEDDEIEERLALLRNSETIQSTLSEIQSALQDSGGIRDVSDKIVQLLYSVQSYDPDIQPMYDLAQELMNNSEELQRTTRNYLDGFDLDAEELFTLEARIDLINALKMKYGQNVNAIIGFCDTLRTQRDRLESASDQLVLLRNRQVSIKEQYLDIGGQLSKKRKTLAKDLTTLINKELVHLNLKGAALKFLFEERDGLFFDGLDKVEILVVTNPGEAFKSIKKIASGGEISRFMLAIKSVIEQQATDKTLIYDEIDTGISGETAEVVGERLYHLSKSNQIISVTHLPQIAVFADHHLIIHKETDQKKARTTILHGEGSHIKRELGRLVSGKTISVNTLKHVEEMMSNAFKKKL